MYPDDSDSAPASSSPQSLFFKGLVGVGIALVVMFLLITAHRPENAESGHGGQVVDLPLPPLDAIGWVNGDAPKEDEFAGKVLVIDAWATWCGPCRQQAPEMVHLYEKYHDQGVEFIGLTQETEESLPQIKQFLKSAGITWRNGFGAGATLDELGAEYIPKTWVVNRQQRIVSIHGPDSSLEKGIQEALAAKQAVP